MRSFKNLTESERNELASFLQSQAVGDVHFDAMTCALYSVDASLFEVSPLGVVIPHSIEQLVNLVNVVKRYRIPLIPRGAATGITGGCLGRGLVVDLSLYLNAILKIDINQKKVTCQPGVVQDDLNKALEPYGYRLGPDTSTGNRATIGGMLSNNAAGSRSLRFGMMADHTQEIELLLSSGELIKFGPMTIDEWDRKRQINGVEGRLYESAWRLREKYRDAISTHFPKIPRRVTGYRLDSLIDPNIFNFAHLIAGSEGTLGIATEITLGIVPKLKSTGLFLIGFNDIHQAFDAVLQILPFSPVACELLDEQIIESGKKSPSLRGKLDWLNEIPKALLIIEFESNHPHEVLEKGKTFLDAMKASSIGQFHHIILESSNMDNVWALRKAGLGILLSKRTYSRAVAFIEDLSIPPQHLAPFMKEFMAYLSSKNKEAGIYGHVGAGCMHIRPYMDLRDQQEVNLMKEMMQAISTLILRYGGTLSGEHGDGLIRSWLNPSFYGQTIMQAFIELKEAFDPDGIMNPGKIIPTSRDLEDLRFDFSKNQPKIDSFQDFSEEGGFELAVDLCNGNGLCRKQEGVMCPSFQVTGEEKDSTRGRAQALRQIIHGRLPPETFTSDSLFEVMDLCLSCKGCKTECPSQVDMAKMKSEFLYHFQEKHGYSLRTRLFGAIGRLNAIAFPFSNIYNWLSKRMLFKKFQSLIGISSFRTLPPLGSQRFSAWLSSYQQPKYLTDDIVLYPDTFTEFNEPLIGQSAVRLLNEMGFRVLSIPWTCCQRPAISKGILKQAKEGASEVLKQLLPYVEKGLPIIGLEPSCILTLRDEFKGLLGQEADILSKHVFTLDEFIAELIKMNRITLTLKQCYLPSIEIAIHGHCHQKSLSGMQSTEAIFNSIDGVNFQMIKSGCCGMAGSFGYEKEHYDISMKMGEQRLFPAIRTTSSQTFLVANGFSCRCQIKDGTARNAKHLAELVDEVCNIHRRFPINK